MAKAEVTNLFEYKGRDMVAALRELLDRAERGALRGFAYTAKTGPKRHRVGFTGDYWDNPGEAVLAGSRMQYKANQFLSAAEDGPETGSM